MAKKDKLNLKNEVAEAMSVSKKEAAALVDAVFDQVEKSLIAQTEKGIVLAGFGTFKTKFKPAGKTKNPFTGEMKDSPAKIKILFRPAKQLKEKVNASITK